MQIAHEEARDWPARAGAGAGRAEGWSRPPGALTQRGAGLPGALDHPARAPAACSGRCLLSGPCWPSAACGSAWVSGEGEKEGCPGRAGS